MTNYVRNPSPSGAAWADTSYWVGGSAAASGATNTVRLRPGRHLITSGHSTGIAVNRFHIPPDATLDTNGTALSIDVNSGTAPQLHVNNAGDKEILLTGTYTVAACYGSQKTSFTGGTLTKLAAMPGSNVEIQASAAVVDIMAINPMLLNILTHASDLVDTLRLAGGNCVTRRTIAATQLLSAARLTLKDTANLSDGSSGGSFVMGDPRAVLRIESEDLTVDATGYLLAGKLDCSALKSNLTWTTALVSGVFDIMRSWAGGSLTITTETKLGAEGFAELSA